MNYEYVNVGALPDDGTGDPLRTAYIKINNNFHHIQAYGTDRITNGTSYVTIPVEDGPIYAGVGSSPDVLVITSSGITAKNVTATEYYFGNGYYLTDIYASRTVTNGTSNVSIPNTNGNINEVVNGLLTLQVSPNLVSIFGDLNVTGNATLAGNITRNAIAYGSSYLGFQSAAGNVLVTIDGTVDVASFTPIGLEVANIFSPGEIIGNVLLGNVVSAGNVESTNVNGVTISATGNVIGENIVGIQGVYGNIFTTLIDSGDSSEITVTPDVRFSATVTIDNELDVSMIMAQRINTSILSASGNVLGPIPSVSNTFYVATNGNDGNDGGLNTPFRTIKQGCAAAQAVGGNVAIRIASGTYVEQNPITIPANTALMGDNLRTVQIKPATISSGPSGDLFYMSGGSYVWGITVRDYLGAAFSYNPTTTTTAYVSPYIQNITSYTTTGTGVRIDGSKAIGTKAMIVGFYTIINRGGIGIDISNSGYSQLVNIYTIAADIGIQTQSGAFCTLNGSDCSIGNYGLVSRGIGPLQTSGNTVGYSTGGTFIINGLLANTQPHVNTVMFINDSEYSTTSTTTLTIPAASVGVQQTLTVGTGLNYSVGQTVIIAYSADPNTFMTGTVYSYTSGSGVLVVDVVGVAGRGSGTYATWRVNLYPLRYYTIDTIIPNYAGNIPAPGNSTVVIQEVYTANLVPSTNVEFYTRSAIIASAHTFEYVGAGTNPATALPQYGGIPVTENEVVTSDGGVVTFTSTDQKGNFRVGKGFTVNQATGTVSGDDFYRSLFAIMTPYILALQEVP